MFTFTVAGQNSAASLYLWELTVQCQIAEYSFNRLKENARVEVERAYESDTPHPKTPIELFADCASFLSATSIVAKLLFAGASVKQEKLKRNRALAIAARRSEALRDLLQIDG